MFLFPFPPTCRLLLPNIFLLSMMIITATGYSMDPNDIVDFMAEHDIAYEEIRDYFDAQLGLESQRAGKDIPRLFPICINSNSSSLNFSKSEGVKEFANILQSMEMAYDCRERALPFYAFDKNTHMASYNKKWKLKITINRLYSPVPEVRNMRQWMHISVEAGPEVKYLYMQSIVGPLGLPSGEFSTEHLPCGGAKIDNASIIYCDYRSKADINHPVAYFGTKSTEGFHINFKWQDISCLESPYLQFILIPIKNLTPGAIMGIDFQPLFSPVYTNFDFDSPDGLITPYYISWSKVTDCMSGQSSVEYDDKTAVPLKWAESSKLDRLPFNEDYEKCLVHNLGRDKDRDECSPGPFECPAEFSLNDIAKSKGFPVISERRKADFENLVKKINCIPCYLPSMEVLVLDGCPRGKESFRFVNRLRSGEMPEYIDYTELLNSPVDAREHGAIAMLIFLIILPVANFIGRFYRDVVVLRCWSGSTDFWLMLHGILHLLGWLLMWISFGKMTTGSDGVAYAEQCFVNASMNSALLNETAVLESLDACIEDIADSSLHVTFGWITAVIYQVLLVSGIFRSSKPKLKQVQLIIHSHFGYAVYILALITVFTTSEAKFCNDIMIWTITSIVVATLPAYAVTTKLSIQEDKAFGVTPPRYRWPILEHIRFYEKSPMQTAKLLILFCYVGILIIIWVCACCSLAAISDSEVSLFGNVSDVRLVSGLFSECRNSSLDFHWKNITDFVT